MNDRPIGRRGLLAAAGGLLLPAAAAGAAAPPRMTLTAVRGETRLVVPLGRGGAWRVSATASPARLVVELPHIAWAGPGRQAGAGVVAEARRAGSGASQTLVLQLAAPVAAPRVAVAGGALRITLQPGPA
ncbi:N-acetylmuramoyl-L-alanine amidase, partial [Paeniroseomonas aquatica]|nr:N-acetylmuramoyl-L-alanine amidase [Paeniroseomonas aquatica]